MFRFQYTIGEGFGALWVLGHSGCRVLWVERLRCFLLTEKGTIGEELQVYTMTMGSGQRSSDSNRDPGQKPYWKARLIPKMLHDPSLL